MDAKGERCTALNPEAARFCLIGASTRVGSDEHVPLAIRDKFETTLASMLPPSYSGIVGYNDKPGRTQAEVLGVIDLALAALPE